ncbi:ABC transporter permease [Shewanella sp. OPT22]|nr:ABC transporter permease [Shewanella sp. OPT22]
MESLDKLTLWSITKTFKAKIIITWVLVAIENALMVSIPLFIGFAIDSLLKKEFSDLITLATIIFLLITISILRRVYDTRAYGKIRIELGVEVDHRLQKQSVTTRNARLDMSRELVDFLEQEVPPLFTAVIQLVASVIILSSFGWQLGVTPVIACLLMLTIYACSHRQFHQLNAKMNGQKEQQVSVLSTLPLSGLKAHLARLNHFEVKISDTEAWVYGSIFFVMFSFVLINLVWATDIEAMTSGSIFSVMSYSLEFMDAAIMLPMVLQTLSRLSEITQRINE